MAIHLTPTELARESGMERRQVIEKCMELGVPIFQGRIDKTLFLASLHEQQSLAARHTDTVAAA
jgi:3-deoxy-D-manno-octulosonate 8-phosphate phosphatase KdsC-like HAD superfamily phosphatase